LVTTGSSSDDIEYCLDSDRAFGDRSASISVLDRTDRHTSLIRETIVGGSGLGVTNALSIWNSTVRAIA
jgi:hypothetical protein